MYRQTDTGSILRIADGAEIPPDPLNNDYQAFLAWQNMGNAPIPAPGPTADALRAMAVGEVQRRLDGLAQAWGYDSIYTAMTYLGDPDPAFAAEAATLRDWRSAVWRTVRAHADAPSMEALLAALPAAPARPVV